MMDSKVSQPKVVVIGAGSLFLWAAVNLADGSL